jgi:GTP-binding protein LepA
MIPQERLRNFCIIAHIDHGKSTLSDRLLEITKTVETRNMKDQLLDSMDIERERGITIKLAPARMKWTKEGVEYTLNLIDTPGHIDFNYEVSRSLAAVDGAVLLVDSTQGVQAQTVANLFLAMEENLEIIPVLNKIDLPAADVPRRKAELMKLIGCREEDILAVSGKTGEGVEALLDAVIERIPAPKGDADSAPRAMVFDSAYDDYKGVVAYVRVIDGIFKKREKLHMMATDANGEILELGALAPKFSPLEYLETGQIGYIVTGLKDIRACRVGDTLTTGSNLVAQLEGYREVRPMVFAGVFPSQGDEYSALRDAMDRLKLNDAALVYEPEHSPALGYGFRCGFLGMLHLEILRERLSREYNMDLVVTLPSVAYRVFSGGNPEYRVIKGALDLPDPAHIDKIEEPWAKVDIITPSEFMGNVMQLCQERKGMYLNTEYLSEGRAMLHYELPLASIIVDFNDKLKSATAGYASLTYDVFDYRQADIVKLDINVSDAPVDAFASLVYSEDAERVGRRVLEILQETIPRTQFVIKLQASVGGKIVASERISAMRKDVTGGLYGGDYTRKLKLLQKQKKGKAKMMAMGVGSVEIPGEAYLKVLKR